MIPSAQPLLPPPWDKPSGGKFPPPSLMTLPSPSAQCAPPSLFGSRGSRLSGSSCSLHRLSGQASLQSSEHLEQPMQQLQRYPSAGTPASPSPSPSGPWQQQQRPPLLGHPPHRSSNSLRQPHPCEEAPEPSQCRRRTSAPPSCFSAPPLFSEQQQQQQYCGQQQHVGRPPSHLAGPSAAYRRTASSAELRALSRCASGGGDWEEEALPTEEEQPASPRPPPPYPSSSALFPGGPPPPSMMHHHHPMMMHPPPPYGFPPSLFPPSRSLLPYGFHGHPYYPPPHMAGWHPGGYPGHPFMPPMHPAAMMMMRGMRMGYGSEEEEERQRGKKAKKQPRPPARPRKRPSSPAAKVAAPSGMRPNESFSEMLVQSEEDNAGVEPAAVVASAAAYPSFAPEARVEGSNPQADAMGLGFDGCDLSAFLRECIKFGALDAAGAVGLSEPLAPGGAEAGGIVPLPFGAHAEPAPTPQQPYWYGAEAGSILPAGGPTKAAAAPQKELVAAVNGNAAPLLGAEATGVVTAAGVEVAGPQQWQAPAMTGAAAAKAMATAFCSAPNLTGFAAAETSATAFSADLGDLAFLDGCDGDDDLFAGLGF